MDQVKQFEQQVFAAIGSSDQISPQAKEQAQNSITQFFQNINTVEFCITNYQNFENITSKLFTLNLILFWIKEKFQQLPPGHIQVIQQFLFSPVFMASFAELSDQLVAHLLSSQSQLIIRIFPNPWADFFTTLIFLDPNSPNFNDVYVKKFLTFFCNDINQLSPINFTQIVNLRNHLQQAGISTQIIQYAVAKCQQGDIVGYQILSNAITLCPIQMFFENQPLQMVFQGGLSNANSAFYIFEALKKTISRSMEPNAKIQLMSHYINPKNILEVIKSFNDQNLFVAAAKLINKSLIIWETLDPQAQAQSNNIGAQYFMLDINFIQINESLSSQVLYSVYTYMIKHNDVILETVKQILNRIIANFSEQTVLDNFETTFQNAERYSNIIINLLQLNISLLQVVESYASSFNFAQNPGVCSMMMYIILQALFKLQQKAVLLERFNNYLNLFVTIFNTPGPYSPAQIICLYIFQILSISQQKLINKDILTSIMSIMVQVVMMNGINETFVNKVFQKVPVFEFHLDKQRIIQIDHRFLDVFIQSNKKNSVTAASKLIQCLAKNERALTNQKYIEFYAQTLLGNNENNEAKLNTYISALSYISVSYLEDSLSQINLAIQIVQNALTQPMVLQNDLALSAFIRSIPRIGKSLLIPTCNQILNYVKGYESLNSICLVLAESSILTSQNNNWAPPFIECLFRITSSLIDDLLVKVNFGVKIIELEQSIKTFFVFVGRFLDTTLKLPWNDCFGQIIKSFVPFINNLLNRFYDSPIFYHSCIKFMANLAKMPQKADKWNKDCLTLFDQIMQTFVPVSFNIVFNVKIDFLFDAWKSVLKDLYAFHNFFATKYKNGLELFNQQLQKYGAPPTFIQSFMKISEMPNKSDSISLFYHDLSIYFHGLNV